MRKIKKRKPRVSITIAYLEGLKRQLDDTEAILERVKCDRDKYREFYINLLKNNVSMASKNEYFTPQAMIVKLSRLLNSVESWYWS